MTIVNSLYFDSPLHPRLFDEYLRHLPLPEVIRIKRFHRWEDAHAGLFSYYLLLRGLRNYHIALKPDEFKRNHYGRPFIDGEVDFNISHSMNIVVCVLSDETTVGVDVEAIRDIDLSTIQQYFKNEWEEIKRSPNALRTFYFHWTRKEAVIKADGRGFGLPIQNLVTSNDTCIVDRQTYYLKTLDIQNVNYMAHMAFAKDIDSPTYYHLTIDQLLDTKPLHNDIYLAGD